MEGSRREMVPLNALQINEDHWGEGSTYKVLDWLQSNYDPETMPPLKAAQVTGREGLWLLGWDNPNGPGLLATIFGEAYAERQLAQNADDIEVAKRLSEDERGEYGIGGKR